MQSAFSKGKARQSHAGINSQQQRTALSHTTWLVMHPLPSSRMLYRRRNTKTLPVQKYGMKSSISEASSSNSQVLHQAEIFHLMSNQCIVKSICDYKNFK